MTEQLHAPMECEYALTDSICRMLLGDEEVHKDDAKSIALDLAAYREEVRRAERRLTASALSAWVDKYAPIGSPQRMSVFWYEVECEIARLRGAP